MNPIRSSLAIAAVALLWLACAEIEPPAPPVARLTARTEDLVRLLDRLATLDTTPLGRAAADLAASLPDCPVVVARAEQAELGPLLAGLKCVDSDAMPAPLVDGHAIDLSWPLEAGAPLHVQLSIDADANVSADLLVPEGATSGVLGLAMPGPDAPGPGVLATHDTLLHARVRPIGGLDLARLVAAEGQGSRLFRLKSALFAGAVLDGTWEGAIYLPRPGEGLPPTALALGFKVREPAIAAMEQFVEDLSETWGVSRSDYRSGAAEGACLPDLRILPDLAPCYVATERALVVGWNAASLERALDGTDDLTPNLGGLRVALDRFGEADAHLAAFDGIPETSRGTGLPWAALRADGRSTARGISLQLQLRAEPGT